MERLKTNTGKVFLVGAGPGDPRLLTLRAVQCLQAADLVLYDGLVNPLVLRHTTAVVERTARARRAGEGIVSQTDLTQRLVAEAKQGKTVVRLKGGDPFIFGRGGEEAAALAEHGIPFEVVPGITAATAASEYAGIPLTHREQASQILFVTGHEDPTKPESNIDYEILANFRGTIVVYMGLHRIEEITSTLLQAGKPSTTPASIISKATWPQQRNVISTLANISDDAKNAELQPPSLIVIGDCVDLHDSLAWFDKMPLFGLNIGITRPPHQVEAQIERALSLGAQPVLMPMIDITTPNEMSPLHQAFSRIDDYGWIVFTSQNGVSTFFSEWLSSGRDMRGLAKCKLACIGGVTAETLNGFHLRADLTPESFRSEALAEALIPMAKDQRVLWPRANRGRDVLPERCRAAGITIDEVVVYEHADAESLPEHVAKLFDHDELHWIGLSSPAIARRLGALLSADQLAKMGQTTKLATISPVTTAAAEEAGLSVSAEATDYTWDGIFDAIIEAESSNP